MATEMKRFTVIIPPELEAEMDKLKKDKFYNSSQAEMVRYLLAEGLEAQKQEEKETA